jgi:DNA-binding NarL/FixJ family response regulator
MDACASTPLQHSPTRLLLVDTDNLFLDDVGGALQANENIDVVATARSIEDAYDCAARHKPDVIVISWGKASRAFVHAALANRLLRPDQAADRDRAASRNHQRPGIDLAQSPAQCRAAGA